LTQGGFSNLGFTPVPNCSYCIGTGLNMGNPCTVCKLQNYQVGFPSGNTNLGQGQFTHGAQYEYPLGYELLGEKIGFWPQPECNSCRGTGYQLGRNNELCIVCPGTNYQPNFNRGQGNQGQGNQGYGNQNINQGNRGSNQGYGNQGINQGLNQGYNQGINQGYGNQGINQGFNQGYGNQGNNQGYGNQGVRDRLGFVPNSDCKKCNGTGMRSGKKGTEKVCKSCKSGYEKSAGKSTNNSNLNPNNNSNFTNSQNLTFTPISNCHLCKGTGFLKEKNNEVCRLCATHVPVQSVQGGLQDPYAINNNSSNLGNNLNSNNLGNNQYQQGNL